MLCYNEATKKKYIESLKETFRKNAENYFLESAGFENTTGKDIALFGAEELFDFFKSIDVITINKVYRYVTFFTDYAEWYFANNKPSHDNHIAEITKEKMIAYTTEIVNKETFIPKELLLKLVSEIPSYVDQFLIMCIYEGVRGEEYRDAMMLKADDIDVGNRIFHLQSGKDITVSQELIDIALRASKQTGYVLPQSPFSTKRPAGGNLDEAEYIFRVRDNSSRETPGASRIYNRFMAYKDFFENPEFTPIRLADSGFTYELLKVMKKHDKKQVKYIYGTPEMNELKERYDYAGTEDRYIARKLKKNGYIQS